MVEEQPTAEFLQKRRQENNGQTKKISKVVKWLEGDLSKSSTRLKIWHGKAELNVPSTRGLRGRRAEKLMVNA